MILLSLGIHDCRVFLVRTPILQFKFITTTLDFFFNTWMYGKLLYFGAKSHNIRRLYWFIIFRVDQDHLAMYIKKCQSLIMFNYNADLAHCMKMPFMETKLNIIVCTFGFN
jgi:hypothetical protein